MLSPNRNGSLLANGRNKNCRPADLAQPADDRDSIRCSKAPCPLEQRSTHKIVDGSSKPSCEKPSEVHARPQALALECPNQSPQARLATRCLSGPKLPVFAACTRSVHSPTESQMWCASMSSPAPFVSSVQHAKFEDEALAGERSKQARRDIEQNRTSSIAAGCFGRPSTTQRAATQLSLKSPTRNAQALSQGLIAVSEWISRPACSV